LFQLKIILFQNNKRRCPKAWYVASTGDVVSTTGVVVPMTWVVVPTMENDVPKTKEVVKEVVQH